MAKTLWKFVHDCAKKFPKKRANIHACKDATHVGKTADHVWQLRPSNSVRIQLRKPQVQCQI